MSFNNASIIYEPQSNNHLEKSTLMLTEKNTFLELPIGAIHEMYYDYRKTDSWKCVKPPSHRYQTAPQILREYRKEFAEKQNRQLLLF